MKAKSSFFNVLGVALALTLPAVVVAQQFTANQPLRAADLAALSSRLDALEAGSGPGGQLVGTIVTADTTAITANADGFIVATPGGSGFGSVGLQAGINSTGRMFRITDGNSLQLIVSAGDVANITAGGLVAPAEVAVRWYPLRRDGALPTCAGCQ